MHKRFIQLIVFLFLIPLNLLAEGHGSVNQEINWWGLGSGYRESPALGWYFLTFLIFVVSLIYFVKKPLLLYLEARSKAIRKAIEEAKTVKAEAEKALKDSQEKLAHLDDEIARMKEEFIKQGVLEKAQLKSVAEQMALQIEKDADAALTGELQRISHRLKQEVAKQVIAFVKEEIKNRANSQFENEMRNEFTRDVGKLMH